MQIVDVLGDHGRDLAGTIERGKRAVTASGPGGRKRRLHGKAPPPRFIARLLACDELVERDRPVARPQSARRAEIGNAAFGRDAGAGEGNDDGRRGDHLAEALNAALKILGDHGLAIMAWRSRLGDQGLAIKAWRSWTKHPNVLTAV